MYLIRLLIFSLLLPACVAAQEEFISPSRYLTRVPFTQLTGGVILMKATFADQPDSLNFILDTGSGGISLDSGTANYFNLKPKPSNRTIRGIAGVKSVSFVYGQTLRLPRLSIDSLDFHINDYSILTTVYGERIDGIIGYSVLSRYVIKVNYDSSYLEFWSRGSLKYPRGGYLLRPLITTLPIQTARVRDERSVNARFLYDMGAGLNMMLSTDFLSDSNLLSKKRKLWAKEAEGLGGKIDMNMTVVKEIRLGPYRFRQVPVYVFDDIYNVTSYPYLGGLLGSDMLRRFNIILNYDKRDIHLLPNTHFKDAFDYAYSGIELYLVNGQIIVGDVAKGSPAEKAGLLEGDVVVAINNNFNQNLTQLKAALQQAGTKAKLIVQRGGELVEVQYKVLNIAKDN